ncbi:palmitoyltransferase ZDHHC6 isoform X1 [Hydra vulgaris]|uniref:Palmitoyltransferase n=1 Tax=Hydra vulgaris TaxID=6087 RepID=T2M5K0_HYDVU|nr:palmitoyltransferase ZDHHC6 [Hydra vulgaris]
MSYRRLLHWGPIITLFIILSLFIISILTVLLWWYPRDFAGKINFVLLFFWLFNVLRNFLNAVWLGPGYLPFQWRPNVDSDIQFLQFCDVCRGYKAPRVHHCKTCSRCSMKMDHHCPWINNCVGHYNHKAFTLFLIFVILSCLHVTTIIGFCIYSNLLWRHGRIFITYDKNAFIQMNHAVMLILFFGFGMSLSVFLSVAFLFYFQLLSIIRNQTGIETWIVEKAENRNREDKFIYPYDLGWLKNIKQVFTWSSYYIGDGIDWPVRQGSNKHALTIEQLLQKEIKKANAVDYVACSVYSGYRFPITLGLKTCFDSPWIADSRIPLNIGDEFLATRWRKHWVFGEKLQNSAESNLSSNKYALEVKGWVPRCCLKDIYDNKNTSSRDRKYK